MGCLSRASVHTLSRSLCGEMFGAGQSSFSCIASLPVVLTSKANGRGRHRQVRDSQEKRQMLRPRGS
jgi:hypothetical protein